MDEKKLILASFFDHPSFINQSILLEKFFRLNGYRVIRSYEYLAGKERDTACDVIVFGSPATDKLRFLMQLFMTYDGNRIAYITCEGRIDTTFFKPTLFKPYKVYANSGFTAMNMMESGLPVHGIIHHAVDMELIEDARRNPAQLPASNPDETIFTYVGQIGVRKRPELFLEAFRRASRKTGYKIKLITVSGVAGLLKPEDHNVIEIARFGSLPYKEVLRIIAGSHYYYHMTTSEGFGLPALEARCLGKPLIALNMQPTTEFIPKGGALWVRTTGVRITEYGGLMHIKEHEYDLDEAADAIVQAHDIRLNYPSQYEDMCSKQLRGASRYDYKVLYKKFLTG
ncbi:MAG: glycosyltransferase [Nitrososphaerota archaeon]